MLQPEGRADERTVSPLHNTGASGSSKTTFGAAVAQKLDAKHLDVDDFLLAPTKPPSIQRREPPEYSALVIEIDGAVPLHESVAAVLAA